MENEKILKIVDDMFVGGIAPTSLKHNWINELAKLEKKRIALHEYLIMKLDERDYHGIADAAMDLRELDARSKAIKEWVDHG